jgi:tetratricopeptide (TPR) repeat protein
VHCKRALDIFRDLEQPRGIGLASIALSEALRRESGARHRHAPEENADLIRQAESYASDAVQIFEKTVPERPRLLEALIELGCVYRQWAWLRPQYTGAEDPSPQELTQKSDVTLRRVIDLAGEDLLYMGIDAQVNLAWLYYYTRRLEQAEEEARKAIASIPGEYYLRPGTELQAQDLPHVFYWVQLGKANLLLGEVAGSYFLDRGRVEGLRDMGKHYTVSLAYDELFSPDFRDIRKGLRAIYFRLKGLNKEEFELVHRGIADAVEEYKLSIPTRLDKFLAKRHLPRRPEAGV